LDSGAALAEWSARFRHIDLIERGPAWLFIRPSEERGLKTPNSTRQLPLTALVPSEELKLLLEWKREFARGPSLFGVSEDLMKTIHKALHTATGTDDTHFHNLRHSFGTWTFLRLMLSDLREIPNLFPTCRKHKNGSETPRCSEPNSTGTVAIHGSMRSPLLHC